MANYNFKPTNREQGFLMPPNMKEWLPEDDFVWFVIDAVRQIDLRPFYSKYRQDGKGNTAYEPAMMVTLLIYAYCLGVRSSRKIERLCQVDVGFRVIAGNQIPLSGPSGSATLHVGARRENGLWTFYTLLVEVKATGETIPLQ